MIRNYTSSTAASTSIGNIIRRLVDFGASHIQQEYAEKKLTAVSFIITMPNGTNVPIRLPARVKQIELMLRKEVRRPTGKTFDRIAEQAQRTAWKFLDEWVQIQLDLVKLDQAEFLEVFLAYVYTPSTGKTFFEQLRDGKFKALALAAPSTP